jgi:hypothetical protein
MRHPLNRILSTCLPILPTLLLAQADSLALRYAATITEAELRTHLEIIAGDEYQGRDTGKEGQKMAAAYLREQFISYGIPPVPAEDPDAIVDGYYQPFRLIEEGSGSIAVEAGGRRLEFMKELIYFNEFLDGDRTVEQVLFLGDGRDMTPVQNGDVVLVVDDGVDDMVPFMGRVQSLAEQARGKGAAILLISSPRTAELREELGHFITGSRMRLADQEQRMPRAGMQTIIIDREASPTLFQGRKPVRVDRLKRGRKVPAAFTLRHTPQRQEVISENVLAYIEGGDKRDELVIITAHYDHIGVENGEIYNGADDDGSGTVALIEIAQAFAIAKQEGNGPRRSVLVMPVSAEEKGLLGSRYYSDNPVFPLENSVANLNIDMIGRTDSVHAGGEPYVYVIGSDRLSTDLHDINETANETYTRLQLDYTFNAEDDPNKFYYRSDHYNFARKGVPAIFYFNGVHEDYHQPTDTVDKIEFDRLHQRTLLVFHTAWILANREDRIRVDKPVR